jgi:hypothetical protein
MDIESIAKSAGRDVNTFLHRKSTKRSVLKISKEENIPCEDIVIDNMYGLSVNHYSTFGDNIVERPPLTQLLASLK